MTHSEPRSTAVSRLNGQKNTGKEVDRRLCIAPMLDWTDRHARYLFRQFSDNILLYTEMITADALLRGDRGRFLAHHSAECPVAIQLGGSNPDALAVCAELAEQAGFQEVNLNAGCPSDRVQSGRFGACLMAEPALVARCVAAMAGATSLPVTLKTRIGIDHQDNFEFLYRFVDIVAGSGCRTFIVHARKAWLKGLSPKQNREVPPLNYDTVYRLKTRFPQLEIIINGGVQSLEQACMHLRKVDGVMIGREAYQNPAILCEADGLVFKQRRIPVTRQQVLVEYSRYMKSQLECGVRLKHMTPPLSGLFQGLAGTRIWKRHISENAFRDNAGIEVLEDAARLAFGFDLAAQVKKVI